MRIRAIATDYDGTLATRGSVSPETVAALERYVASGSNLLLVTGRELRDLRRIFSGLHLFDCVVAENGALLYRPVNGEEKLLCPPVPRAFISELEAEHVPLAIGRAIVATDEPHHEAVERAIRRNGFALHVSLNKGSVMVLPAGVDKASGLRHALAALDLSPEEVAGIGDAENDLAFLDLCGCAVAVANALPDVKSRADTVTAGGHGAGVAEFIDQLLVGNHVIDFRRRGPLPSLR